jgi:hypothetical protein
VQDNLAARRVRRSTRWYHKLIGLLAAILFFEVGVFLLVFPWMDAWEQNYFATLIPEWRHLWTSRYMRGAVSGLGILNMYFALGEALRLRRYSEPADRMEAEG